MRFVALVVCLFAMLPTSASAEGSSGRLEISPDGVVEGTVEGRTARWIMRGDGPSAPVLNAKEAARLGVRSGFVGMGVKIKIGPTTVKGLTGVMRYTVGGVDAHRRAAWFEREIAPGLSGSLGPGSVSQPVVTFSLHAPVAGERVTSLPLADRGLQGIGTVVRVGSDEVFVQFDPLRSRSMVTAAGGVTLAQNHDGSFVGPERLEPVWFGIERPVRLMRLAEPLHLGGFIVRLIDVRTVDQGDAGSIPDADSDPNEIVVTADKRSGRAYRTLHVGADALVRCSSISFDKAAKVIRLSCASE